MITITSTANAPAQVYLDDLGIDPISTPFTELDIGTTYGLTLQDITESQDLQSNIDNGYVILKVNGSKVTKVADPTSATNVIVLNATSPLSTASSYYKVVDTLIWTAQEAGKYRISFDGIMSVSKKGKEGFCRVDYSGGSIAAGYIKPKSGGWYGSSWVDKVSVHGSILLDMLAGDNITAKIRLKCKKATVTLVDGKLVIERIVY